MHILFVTFFDLFVFHLQVDVVGPLLLNTIPQVLHSAVVMRRTQRRKRSTW